MKRYFLTAVLVYFASFLNPGFVFAQEQQIEIVFDASRSMNEMIGQNTRLDEAKKALTLIAEQIAPGAKVGLRIFGKTPVQGNVRDSCFDSKLEIPIQPYQKQAMLDQVVGLAANGQTPLGYSLELAGQDFAPDPGVKKTVILISDGEESCGKDPINVIGSLKARGISYVVHAVGLAVDAKTKAQLQQITNMTGGTYQDAQNAAQLKDSLQKVAEQEKIIQPAKNQPAKTEAPAELTQEELLLRAQRGKGENLLSAVNGAKIVSATNEDVAYVIDGSDDTYAALDPGVNAVLSFKDNQPVLLESFAIPILEEGPDNPKEIILSGSLDNPQTGFFPIATAVFTNKVDFKNVYQEFKIDPPAAIRYLKVTAGATFGSSVASHREWRVFGKVLSEEEFKAKASGQSDREISLIAKDAGGHIVAASSEGFELLIDGNDGANAETVSLDAENEIIFGFQGDQTAYLTKFGLPIYEAADSNCKTFEVSVSEQAPDSGFTSAGTFQTTNLLMSGKPFQDYKFSQLVRAKYVKVKLIDDHGGNGYCDLSELRIFGTFKPPAVSAAALSVPAVSQASSTLQKEAPAAPAAVKEETQANTSEDLAGKEVDFYSDFKTEEPKQ